MFKCMCVQSSAINIKILGPYRMKVYLYTACMVYLKTLSVTYTTVHQLIGEYKIQKDVEGRDHGLI